VADFPTFKIDRQSKRNDRDGRVIDTDADGIAHVRKLYTDKGDFTLTLTRMSGADVASLFTHYNANPLSTFNFFWAPDAATYVVKYGKRPELLDYAKGTYTYRVTLLAGA
jgi:hypothetical protein